MFVSSAKVKKKRVSEEWAKTTQATQSRANETATVPLNSTVLEHAQETTVCHNAHRSASSLTRSCAKIWELLDLSTMLAMNWQRAPLWMNEMPDTFCHRCTGVSGLATRQGRWPRSRREAPRSQVGEQSHNQERRIRTDQNTKSIDDTWDDDCGAPSIGYSISVTTDPPHANGLWASSLLPLSLGIRHANLERRVCLGLGASPRPLEVTTVAALDRRLDGRVQIIGNLHSPMHQLPCSLLVHLFQMACQASFVRTAPERTLVDISLFSAAPFSTILL